MTLILLLEEDEEPMATEPKNLSSDGSEYSTPNTTPDHHNESIYPDSTNQLRASQLEQKLNMDTAIVFYPPTRKSSMISDDEEHQNFTPIIGNPEQHKSHLPQRSNHAIQLCRHLQPASDTPKSPSPLDQGQTFSVPLPTQLIDISTI